MVRKFDSGATRDSDFGKLDFEGFLSPIVLHRFAVYMDKHRLQTDGVVRESDNWQKLFGEDHESVCMKSLLRHVMDLWLSHRGFVEIARDSIEESLCAIIFNANAYLFSILEKNHEM